MNLYSPEELDAINKARETNNNMEEFFTQKRDEWNKQMAPLFDVMKMSFTTETSQKLVEIQSNALSYRQMMNEQISFFLNRRSKEETKLKKARQDKFVFYATGFGLKTNLGEKAILIDAHVAEYDRGIQLIDVHVDFLRNSSKNLESLGYSIKNLIDLFNYLK